MSAFIKSKQNSFAFHMLAPIAVLLRKMKQANFLNIIFSKNKEAANNI